MCGTVNNKYINSKLLHQLQGGYNKMTEFEEISSRIKTLKEARDILKELYSDSSLHQKKEQNPQEASPMSAEDEEVYRLLTAIQQLEKYIKQYQDVQFELIKDNAQ